MLASAAFLNAEQGWPDKSERPKVVQEWIFDFLNHDIRNSVRSLVTLGNRIPEEVVNDEDMRHCFENW